MTQDKVINAAFELFSQRGIRSVTMDDIAQYLGMSKRTIYENFKDKEDLLIKTVSIHDEKNRQEVLKMLNESKSCLTGLLNVIYRVSKEIEAHHSEIFIIDLKKYYPEVWEKRQEEKRKYILSMATYLQKGVAEGTVRNDLNLNLISLLLQSQIEGIELIPDIIKQFSKKEIIQTMVLSFCRGISTTKGIAEIDEFMKTHDDMK